MSAKIAAEIYEKHGAEALRFAVALVGPSSAEDLVSNAVLSSLSSQAWDEVENPPAYLYRVVWNEAHKHRRALQRRQKREARAAERVVEDHTSGTDLDVVGALQRLTPRQRAVVYLTYWVEMTAAETAVLLATSQRTVERDLTKARQTLRRVLR